MDEESSSEEEDNLEHDQVARFKLVPRDLQSLLCPFADDSEAGAEKKQIGVQLKQMQRKTFLEQEYRRSLQISRAVWSTDAVHHETGPRLNPGHMFSDTYAEHVRAAPFDAERCAAASWTKAGARQNLDVVFQEICGEPKPPKA